MKTSRLVWRPMRVCLVGLMLLLYRHLVRLMRLAGIGAVSASFGTAAGHALPDATRPNILLIYTDDQRYDALGVVQREQGEDGRFPWLRTPHLDRLAEGGLRFREAFVVNSVCSPSRACTLTGVYNHLNGVKDNWTELAAHHTTIGALLQRAGYTTGYFGKWHMGRQATRPGFQHWASQLGHGQFIDCDLNINGQTVPTKGWLDDVVTDHALEFMRAHKAGPFFAVIGFKAPHSPYTRRESETKAYEAVVARPVPNLGRLPAPVRDLDPERRPFDPTQLIRDHFRLLDGVDVNLGRILDLLDLEGLAGNTLVVFTSDNGYFLGEHGVGDKRYAYEESIRVPLLMRWPAGVRAGGTTGAMALNIDLAPTFLELAGAPVPSHLQGVSLAPVLRDPAHQPRSYYFYEYFREERAPYHPTVFAIRTRGEKLIHSPENPAWTELYDLAADPFETTNLVGDPARAPLLARLRGLMLAEADRLGLSRQLLGLEP